MDENRVVAKLAKRGCSKKAETDNVSLWIDAGIAVVVFDRKGEKVNTLNSKLLPEFDEIFSTIEADQAIHSVVILSGKEGCFVAGADIEELNDASSIEAARKLSEGGQLFFSRLAASKKKIIAAIDGSCLGGGLELALACHHRIATSSPKTQLGLPEVMLGLLPGAGGTQRLPRLIGLEKAMTLMLTGRALRAEQALKMGIVDHVTTSEGLVDVALNAADRLASKALTFQRRKPKGMASKLEKVPFGRQFMFNQALKSVNSKTRGLYPAPKAIIDCISYGLDHGMAKGLKKEAEAFAQLTQTTESKGLISLYFGQNDLKKNRFGKPSLQPKELGVLGAGLMGAGISLVSIQKGFDVRMKDISQESLGKGRKYVWKSLNSRVKRRSMSRFDANRTMSHLFSQLDYDRFSRCDVVIEAVFEDMELKHRVVKEVEAHMREDAVFASNTSALPIGEIAKASARPENFLGMHYFSPVHKMPLLEIITTDQTSERASALAVQVGIQQGKTVIVVKDGPGFYTTRILVPYMDEAAFVCGEGVGFHQLDGFMKDFGYPVGPMTLIDEVGIDVAFHVGHDLGSALGKRVSGQEPLALKALMDKGAMGRKSGVGFFVYEKPSTSVLGKIPGLGPSSKRAANPDAVTLVRQHGKRPDKMSSKADIQKRLAYRMINEAAYCLQEGILPRPLEGDIGAVFGLGFPPFHGGPFRYLDTVGVGKVVDDLKRFSDRFGERFTPCPMLVSMASNGQKFYGESSSSHQAQRA